MHQRLERVAVDGPDHIDGMAYVGIPARFQTISASRAAGVDRIRRRRPGQCTQCRTGSIVPAATPSTNTHGSAAENQRRQGPGPRP